MCRRWTELLCHLVQDTEGGEKERKEKKEKTDEDEDDGGENVERGHHQSAQQAIH